MAMAITDCDDRRSEIYLLEKIDCYNINMIKTLLSKSFIIGY